MNKPLGMDMGLNVKHKHPSTAENSIWAAVQDARAVNWTPRQFIQEVREAWLQNMKDEMKAIDETFARALQ